MQNHSYENDFDSYENDFDSHENDFDSYENDFDSHENDFDSYENDFDSLENETACRTHFHMKSFALRPILKQRHKRTRKWPIVTLKSQLPKEPLTLFSVS